MAPIAEAHRRALAPAEYAAIVARACAVVCEHVPPGATVAVISRGDDALLALGGRRGWHFPRAADGAYAGHHPPDATAAVLHLEELQSSGAHYLLVPASARWWLDHYEGFAAHLHERCEQLVDEPACALYAIGAPLPARTAPSTLDAATGARLGRFLDALLPERCDVLLAGGEGEQLALAPRAVQPLPDRLGAALAALESGRDPDRPTYLVVPLAGERDDWSRDLLDVVERRRPPLARRPGLAAVFDLHAPTTSHG